MVHSPIVPGIRIGNAQDLNGMTGITVVLCEEGSKGGVCVVGGAPGTRETDLMRPSFTVDEIHGVFLAGGSAFGLDAAAGIVKFLESRGTGFDTGVAKVPIVCGAILFDLGVGSALVRPTPEMAYESCLNASEREILTGNVGAGTGATVGKLHGPSYAMKSGLGYAYGRSPRGYELSVVVAVNALGDVVDPTTGKVIAGAYDRETRSFLRDMAGGSEKNLTSGTNTTIAIVATDALLSKEECNRIAQMATAGIARAIVPSFTPFDGDTVFVVSTGKSGRRDEENRARLVAELGIASQNLMVSAILDAVISCESYGWLTAARDIQGD
jgi:L-aminopeptidase/D-esterase-like protein